MLALALEVRFKFTVAGVIVRVDALLVGTGRRPWLEGGAARLVFAAVGVVEETFSAFSVAFLSLADRGVDDALLLLLLLLLLALLFPVVGLVEAVVVVAVALEPFTTFAFRPLWPVRFTEARAEATTTTAGALA